MGYYGKNKKADAVALHVDKSMTTIDDVLECITIKICIEKNRV